MEQNKKHLTDHQKLMALFLWVMKRFKVSSQSHTLISEENKVELYYDNDDHGLTLRETNYIQFRIDKEILGIVHDLIRVESTSSIHLFRVNSFIREFKKACLNEIKKKAREKRERKALEKRINLNLSEIGEIISQTAEELKNDSEFLESIKEKGES